MHALGGANVVPAEAGTQCLTYPTNDTGFPLSYQNERE